MQQPTLQIITTLQSLGSEEHRLSKQRLGIPYDHALGVSLPAIRELGKQYKRNQQLAIELWASGYHEARLLAVLVADPKQSELTLIEQWLGDVVSWDLCDHLCNNLMVKLPACVAHIPTWAADEREFVRRAAFALIVNDVMHNKQRDPEQIECYFSLLRRYANDDRLYVRKAVSWALREMGKRDDALQGEAILLARELSESNSNAERWIGKDVLKELESLVSVPGHSRKVPAK